VEVRRADIKPEDLAVTLPEEPAESARKRQPLTVEVILERISQDITPQSANTFRRFLDEIQELGVELVGREASLVMLYVEPTSDATFSPGYVSQDAAVRMYYVVYYVARAGLDRRIAMDYLETVARLVPGAQVRVRERKSGPTAYLQVGSRPITLDELMPHANDWLAAVDKLISRVSAALRDVDAGA
jgi:hypothetical protein